MKYLKECGGEKMADEFITTLGLIVIEKEDLGSNKWSVTIEV